MAPVTFAAVIPQSLVLTISLGSGAAVAFVLFVVLFIKSRPPRMIERIAVAKGSAAGQGTAVKGRIRIGRDEANDLAIEDDELSRFHCEVRPENGVAILIDMQSANGTILNGKEVSSAMLKAGDEIRIGRQLLRCS